jgi:hypothetical protein
MTAQETNLLNAFETTLTGTIGASDLTFTVNSVTDSASNTLAAPCYLILNPDSATNREVVLVTSVNSGTKTLTLDNINKRYLTGSAATSGLSHASGSVVRMSPVQQHIEDINDRVDTIINEAGTAVNTSLFLDEDDMSSNSATKGVTQQSVKAYVDTQLTAEDLDISADSGSNIAIDLDSEVLDLEGGTGIDTTTGTNKVTFAIDSTVATLTGSQALTNKTIDVDSNTVSNIEVDNLKSGVLDTDLSSVSGSDDTLASAKAIKTYVDTQITAEDLDVTADSGGPISIDLDSETLDIAGGTGITTTASGNEISIAIDSTVVTESSTDTLTNKTIDADGTGNSITNIEDANIKSAAAIDASKIADGSVSNAEFQRLDGVTSDIQTQLDGKQASGSYITASSTDTFTNKTIDADGTGNSITNIEDANIKASAAIDASKIADGSVSNAEFQRLDGVTSDIQTQLDAKGVGDITAVNTAANSGLAGGAASGDASLTVDPSNLADGSSVTVDTANDLLILEDATDGTVYKVKPNQIASGSANALVDGDSDFTITDGVANGIHYELDNTDMADWNQGGVALTAAGGIFRHNQTQSATYTIAATEGTVLAGPITITGTVTNAGTMVIL